jgi:DNA translocase FtsK/SpoIIIE-like protein
VAHTFLPERQRQAETVAGISLIAAAVASIVVFWPPEGQVLAPLHEMIDALFGRTAFLVPLFFALVAACALVRRARPEVSLPRRKVAGVSLIALALFPAERLMGDSTGLIGDRLTEVLVGGLGAPLTVVAIVTLVAVGVLLVFDINLPRSTRLAAR